MTYIKWFICWDCDNFHVEYKKYCSETLEIFKEEKLQTLPNSKFVEAECWSNMRLYCIKSSFCVGTFSCFKGPQLNFWSSSLGSATPSTLLIRLCLIRFGDVGRFVNGWVVSGVKRCEKVVDNKVAFYKKG